MIRRQFDEKWYIIPLEENEIQVLGFPLLRATASFFRDVIRLLGGKYHKK
jgi:hypothetical protein